MSSNPLSVILGFVRVVVALVRFFLAVVEMVRVPSAHNVFAAMFHGVAVIVPRAGWLLALTPPRRSARR